LTYTQAHPITHKVLHFSIQNTWSETPGKWSYSQRPTPYTLTL